MMKSMPEITLRSYSTGESVCSDKANTLRDAALIQTRGASKYKNRAVSLEVKREGHI